MDQEYDIAISYNPLPDEVDPSGVVVTNEIILAPRSKNSDPVAFAQECIEKCGDKKAVVLIPGRAFDKFGTRHGRGGGWYDRFLAEVPRDWKRIGICKQSQLSDKKLPREKWDQEMDDLVVVT